MYIWYCGGWCDALYGASPFSSSSSHTPTAPNFTIARRQQWLLLHACWGVDRSRGLLGKVMGVAGVGEKELRRRLLVTNEAPLQRATQVSVFLLGGGGVAAYYLLHICV